MYDQVFAIGCLAWYAAVAAVTTIGTVQIFRHYSRPPRHPVSSRLQNNQIPHVTIIRPCNGLEPFLYECLAATFHQEYPLSRLSVHFCVTSKSDKAYTLLQHLIKDFPRHDARIYLEEEDPVARGLGDQRLGPNPKIRNMSRAYREARGDIVWILDCNIWVGYGALGRMVDKLCGFARPSSSNSEAQTQRPYKLVAHLPVCIDVDTMTAKSRGHSTSISATDDPSVLPFVSSSNTAVPHPSDQLPVLTGSMLETSFLSTAHAKMYVAINSVSIAPCINGKSTMFRKSHLDHLAQGQGIDHFSHNICEDHLIGDLLWKSSLPSDLGFSSATMGKEILRSNPRGLKYRNHGLAVGDLAIQPMAGMSVVSYIARRVRWLRVRKFTVMLATLIEPGTESLLCSSMGAYAITTLRPLQELVGSSWSTAAIIFTASVLYWMVVDWFVSGVIQGMGSVETQDGSPASRQDQHVDTDIVVPPFARPIRRRFTKWLTGWLGREGLALPIWTWAIWGGTTVTWRERRFWVGMDMRVHEVEQKNSTRSRANGHMSGKDVKAE